MDWSVVGAVWALCAVGAWFVAHTKGAPNEVTWGILGLLFGPFGVVAAIIFAKPAPVPAAVQTGVVLNDQGQAGTGKLCGRCGKPLSPVWRGKCGHCGASYAEFPPVARA